jgi:flagellar biosynthesis anti-sigma factor FlgM
MASGTPRRSARDARTIEPTAGVYDMNPIHNVNNAASSSPVQKVVSNPIQKQVPADAPKQLPVTDRVELSGMSQLLKTLKAGGDIRTDKVASIKAQIEAGTYETDDKLTAAADKLLDELMRD